MSSVPAALLAPRQRSFDDLGTPLHDVVFCVIDLETTGGNRTEDAITEVGAVKVRGGEFIGTFQTLVNPGRAIPPRVALLTGLTDAVVAAAPPIGAVLPSLLQFLGDAVIVGHNVGFDLAFLRRALDQGGRPPLDGPVVDTVALARRLVRDEVPDCRLGTLASRLRLDHRPSHRALDDALATVDLLHLLIERASGLGVTGLDDLVALASLSGHPQAAKLRLTSDLPRHPGVYMFCGAAGEVLYVGKATNLRQRVRGYFGSDDRRKVGAMLRETQRVRHIELPDPLTAEVVESRLIGELLPRYNRRGTRAATYCYVRLDVDQPWPRLAIVKNPDDRGTHLGPLSSRAVAQRVVDALHDALPLRRCSRRLGRSHRAEADAAPCVPAQLGVAHCPCAGATDAGAYRAAVEQARRALGGDTTFVADRLNLKMSQLAAQRRFEEAAVVRDRLAAVLAAARRHHLVEALRDAGRAEVSLDGTTWVIEQARLVDVTRRDRSTGRIPVAPPPPVSPDRPMTREGVDEALCLARFLDARSSRLAVRSSGPWRFPVAASDTLPRLLLPHLTLDQ